MDPEGLCTTVVRARLVCHGYNSAHNTLASPAVAPLRCLLQRVLYKVIVRGAGVKDGGNYRFEMWLNKMLFIANKTI